MSSWKIFLFPDCGFVPIHDHGDPYRTTNDFITKKAAEVYINEHWFYRAIDNTLLAYTYENNRIDHLPKVERCLLEPIEIK